MRATLTCSGLLSIALHAALLNAMMTQRIGSSSSEVAQTSLANFFELPARNAFDDVDVEEMLAQYGQFMLGNMNRSVDPCENFYDYACGNWKQSTLVPAQGRSDTFLHTIQLQINGLLLKFLENSTETMPHTAEAKAKQFYASCVQLNKDMPRGYRQLMAETDDRYVGQRLNESVDWIYINFMSHYEMYPLLPLKVHYHTQQRKFDVLVSPPRKVLGNADVLDFKNLTRDFKIESELRQQELKSEFEMLVEFEKNLTSHAATRNTSEFRTLSEFLTSHKQEKFNWTRYFELAFNGTQQQDWMIYNTVDSVEPLVRFLQRTELHTLRLYLKWRTLLKFYYIWKQETTDKLVNSTCRDHTEQYFNYALLPWFIEQVFDADRRADILELAKHIKEAFYELIDRYTWLDGETKSQAKTKLAAMDVLVGYSDDMRHRSMIDQVYAEVNMTSDWFENLHVLERNRALIRMRSVNKGLIPTLMSTRSVNAYYADFLNLAQITIGMAQWPFYHLHMPAALKYGGIGNIIGHEMAHGFDSYCYQFNYDGKNMNWWTEASLRNFRERYRCLESQYNKYLLLGSLTNGTMTSGENIADNVGTRIAYYAYMAAGGGKSAGDKRPIAGVDYTHKQLFFLKYAQTWCNGKDNEYKLRRLKTDVHAYEEFRVIGTLSNMPEFSEAFKCKLGTEMNPLKKCVVW